MSGHRRRVLSTFQISKSGPSSGWPTPVELPQLEQRPQVSSAVRRRRVLDIGLSPRLYRQTSDLRLLYNEDRGWDGRPNSQVFAKMSTLCKTLHDSIGAQTLNGDPKIRKTDAMNTITPMFLNSNQNGSHAPYKLRRPTAFPVPPVRQTGPLFHLLVKGKDLKPLVIENDDDACAMFYASHFPLLLRKMSSTSESVPAKRVMTEIEAEEQIRLSERRSRTRLIRERIAKSEEMLRGFETDPEDRGPIETELRGELFNPTIWPWNLERYSLARLM